MWRNPRHAVLGEAIAIDDGVRPSGHEAADWSHSRRRLFVVLGWTAAGLGTTAAFMGLFHFVFLSRIELIETGFRSVGLCTTVGFACVFAVVWAAHEFCAGSRVRARVLLCMTCVVYALLMNVFTAGVITEGLMGTASHGTGGGGRCVGPLGVRRPDVYLGVGRRGSGHVDRAGRCALHRLRRLDHPHGRTLDRVRRVDRRAVGLD